METWEEKIKKIWKEDEEKYKRHKEILQLFNSSKPPHIQPMWHTEISEVDLSKQIEKLPQDKLEGEFTIIDNVDIELLFDNMLSENPGMFREKVLFNSSLNETKIINILEHWIIGTKLIPPTILVFDIPSTYNLSSNTNQMFPIDGKHRINVAYYFGATKIPILVIKKDFDKIKTILNL